MKTLIKILCLSVLWFSCENSTEPQDVHGCLDSQACNYNSNANIDNNSCIYEEDCAGACNENVELWGECYNIKTTTTLDLSSYNSTEKLTGKIPPEIGNLTNLRFLILHHNQLTGEIPPEIGNLTNLTTLNLYNNQLTGEIPPEIGLLTNLQLLYLHTNQLIGEIPKEIENLINLKELYLLSNKLTGEIPEEICNVISLRVGYNQLCPPYLECISQEDIDSQDTSNCP